MHRHWCVVVLAAVACREDAPAAAPVPDVIPVATTWPHGRVIGAIGRGRGQPKVVITMPAELRDVPPLGSVSVDTSLTSDLPGDVRNVAIAGTELYVATDAGVAAFDLVAHTWTWKLALPGATRVLASETLVVVNTAADAVAIVEGKERWRAHGAATSVSSDAVVVGGLVRDVGDGHPLGATARGVVPGVVIDQLVVCVEGDRLVARLAHGGMLPAWALELRGQVVAIAVARDGVVVTLADNDSYRIDRMGVVSAIAGFPEALAPSGDLLIGVGIGGPIPPSPIVPPVLPKEVYQKTDLEVAPALAVPWPPPPVMPSSLQVAFYDLAGAFRVRNDYPITHAALGVRAGAAPVILASDSTLLVLDPTTGAPLRRVEVSGVPFSAIVDRKPITGTIIGRPLRVVLF